MARDVIDTTEEQAGGLVQEKNSNAAPSGKAYTFWVGPKRVNIFKGRNIIFDSFTADDNGAVANRSISARAGSKISIHSEKGGLEVFDQIFFRVGKNDLSYHLPPNDGKWIVFVLPDFDQFLDQGGPVWVGLKSGNDAGVLSDYLNYQTKEKEKEEKSEKTKQQEGGIQERLQQLKQEVINPVNLMMDATGTAMGGAVKPFLPNAILKSQSRNNLKAALKGGNRQKVLDAIKEVKSLGDTEGLKEALSYEGASQFSNEIQATIKSTAKASGKTEVAGTASSEVRQEADVSQETEANGGSSVQAEVSSVVQTGQAAVEGLTETAFESKMETGGNVSVSVDGAIEAGQTTEVKDKINPLNQSGTAVFSGKVSMEGQAVGNAAQKNQQSGTAAKGGSFANSEAGQKINGEISQNATAQTNASQEVGQEKNNIAENPDEGQMQYKTTTEPGQDFNAKPESQEEGFKAPFIRGNLQEKPGLQQSSVKGKITKPDEGLKEKTESGKDLPHREEYAKTLAGFRQQEKSFLTNQDIATSKSGKSVIGPKGGAVKVDIPARTMAGKIKGGQEELPGQPSLQGQSGGSFISSPINSEELAKKSQEPEGQLDGQSDASGEAPGSDMDEQEDSNIQPPTTGGAQNQSLALPDRKKTGIEEQKIEAVANEASQLMNAALSKLAFWVWGSAWVTLGLSIFLGAIAGDVLLILKGWIARKFLTPLLNTSGLKNAEGEISKKIKFSGQVKMHILGMNLAAAAMVMVIIVFVMTMLWGVCKSWLTYPIKNISGMDQICQSIETSTIGTFANKLTQSGSFSGSFNVPGQLNSTQQWTNQINQHSQKWNIDACILRVVVQKESSGNPNSIGHDGHNGVNDQFNLINPPAYNLNWSYSHGIGLTQWTIFPYKAGSWIDSQTPSRNIYSSWYKVSDLLNPDTSLDLTARDFSTKISANSSNLSQRLNSVDDPFRAALRMSYAQYNGGSNPNASAINYANASMVLYDMCKNNGN